LPDYRRRGDMFPEIRACLPRVVFDCRFFLKYENEADLQRV
jgi:hypothetical protein